MEIAENVRHTPKMPPAHVGWIPRVQRGGEAVIADVVLLRLPAVSMKGIGTGFFGREGRIRCRKKRWEGWFEDVRDGDGWEEQTAEAVSRSGGGGHV